MTTRKNFKAYEVELGVRVSDGTWAYVVHEHRVRGFGTDSMSIDYVDEVSRGGGYDTDDEARDAAVEDLDDIYGKGRWQLL